MNTSFQMHGECGENRLEHREIISELFSKLDQILKLDYQILLHRAFLEDIWKHSVFDDKDRSMVESLIVNFKEKIDIILHECGQLHEDAQAWVLMRRDLQKREMILSLSSVDLDNVPRLKQVMQTRQTEIEAPILQLERLMFPVDP